MFSMRTFLKRLHSSLTFLRSCSTIRVSCWRVLAFPRSSPCLPPRVLELRFQIGEVFETTFLGLHTQLVVIIGNVCDSDEKVRRGSVPKLESWER
jgi:hypothetical protein